MPLERAKIRQDVLEKWLLDAGEMEIDLGMDSDIVESDLISVMNKLLCVATYLALNMRDCIMLLNRDNPDSQAPDGKIPVIGQRVTPVPPDEGPVTGERPDGVVRADESAYQKPPGEEAKTNDR
jgi:hypothetical protein